MSGLPTIKRRQDFLAAARSGKKIATGTLVLQAHQRAEDHPAGTPPRVGFTVTKKMGNAPQRSRIKRRLRTALRKAQPPMKKGHDYVIISRHKALDCPFDVLLRDMAFAFSRIDAKKGVA